MCPATNLTNSRISHISHIINLTLLVFNFKCFKVFLVFLQSSKSELQHVWPDPGIPNTSEASSVESQLFARKPTALKTRIGPRNNHTLFSSSLSIFHPLFQETCCFTISNCGFLFHCHLENTAISFGFRETPKAPSGQDLISDLSDPDQILDMKGHKRKQRDK